jgi:hypothetical protein
MNVSRLFGFGFALVALAVVVPAHADVAPPPTGGSTSTTVAAAGSGTTTTNPSSDEGGCSVVLVRNTSAAAAGLIALALTIGMARLRRYGVRRS